MNQILQPDSTYWQIFDHVGKISAWVETVGALSPAKAVLFGLLCLLPFLGALYVVLNKFNFSDKHKKIGFGVFVTIYALGIFYLKMEAQNSFENYALKKRVLNEMVYKLVTKSDAASLCNALDIYETDLSNLAKRDVEYFHYRKNEKNQGQFSIVNEEIKGVIRKKKKALEETIAAQEIISVDSIQSLAHQVDFGNVDEPIIEEIVKNNEQLVYTEQFKVVELKKENLIPFAQLPQQSQINIASSKFDPSVFQKTSIEYSKSKKQLSHHSRNGTIANKPKRND